MSNKSNNNSLRARLSQPNRKVKLNEWKRINDPYEHQRSLNKII